MSGRVLKSEPSAQFACKRESKGDVVHTHSSESSGSEFGSYCEITSIALSEKKSPPMTLVERQNSQNEEKEGLLDCVMKQNETYTKHRMQNPEASIPKVDLCDCKYLAKNEETVLTVNLPDEVFHETKKSNKSKFSSGKDTNWTDSEVSGTKKVTCSSCCCTVAISTVVSVLVSACTAFLLFLYFTNSDLGVNTMEPVQQPYLAQSSSEELRRHSGLESHLSRKNSRALLYLDQKALKVDKKLLWTSTNLQDAFMSHDLTTSTYEDLYGCLVVSEEGFYSVFSKLTLYYTRNTTDSVFYHSTNLIREGEAPRQLVENRYTPLPKENRPPVGNIYLWSILPGYYHLKSNDQICIMVSNIERVYKGPTYSFFSIYML